MAELTKEQLIAKIRQNRSAAESKQKSEPTKEELIQKIRAKRAAQQKPMTDDELNMAIEQGSAESLFKHGAPIAAGLVADYVLPGSRVVRAGASGAIQGGVQGAMLPAENFPERASNIASGAASGLVSGFGFDRLGAGLGKIGDIAMQKSVGLKKYIPGLGTILANEGIVGTQGMMRGQVDKRAAKLSSDVGKAIAKNETKYGSEKIAEEVAKLKGTSEMLPGGSSLMDKDELAKIDLNYEDIATRPNQTLTQLWERAQDAGERAYKATGNPATSDIARMSAAEQTATSDLMKSMSPEYAEYAPKYTALASARRELKKPPSIADSAIMLKMLGAPAAGAGVGYYTGGTPGAMAGLALGSSAGLSTVGQLTSKAAPAVGSPAARALLIEMIRAEEAKKK